LNAYHKHHTSVRSGGGVDRVVKNCSSN